MGGASDADVTMHIPVIAVILADDNENDGGGGGGDGDINLKKMCLKHALPSYWGRKSKHYAHSKPRCRFNCVISWILRPTLLLVPKGWGGWLHNSQSGSEMTEREFTASFREALSFVHER